MDKSNSSYKLVGAVVIITASAIGAYYLYFNSKKDKDKTSENDNTRKPSLLEQREMVNRIKLQGNKFFNSRDYENAIKCYDEALNNCPLSAQFQTDKAILYQNKSAALYSLDRYDEALSAVDKALEITPRYKNALIRRSKIYENLGRKKEALYDIAAAVIFDNTEQSDSINRMNEIIRTLSIDNVERELKGIPILQSDLYINMYFESFPSDPLLAMDDSSKHTDQLNELSCLKLLKDRKYEDSFQAVQVELTRTDLGEEIRSYLYLLRGTFYLLSCKEHLALSDFAQVIESNNSTPYVKINAIIKRASIMLGNKNTEDIQEAFSEAVEIDSNCPDIYYHRGLMYEMDDQHQDASNDYKMALNLYNNYTCAAAHKMLISCTSEEDQETDFPLFQSLVSQFPNCIEARRMYIKLLMDETRLEEAENASMSLLLKYPNCIFTLLSKAQIKIDQRKKEEAIEILSDAIERIPKHAESHHTLAVIFIKNGELEKAIEHLDQAIRYARSRKDMREYFELREGILAQLKVAEKFEIGVVEVMQKISQGAIFSPDT